MTSKRKILAYSLCASLGLLSTTGGANALSCNNNNPIGTWHFFGLAGNSPNIKSTYVNVRNADGTGTVTIRVFPATSTPYYNGTSTAIKCVLNVAAGGNFTGSCTAIGVTASSGGTLTVGGNVALAACNLTGTINVQGEPTPVTIVGGHINGNSGAGIATQGPKWVLYFTLIKN